ncbi:methyltransferase family protein [Leptospirillum ferriphilum]|uniref:methyltransferase family protein n=1 Tax=Leptospirillum ferriphilum TaxID=178606 RepID=UPI003EE7C794
MESRENFPLQPPGKQLQEGTCLYKARIPVYLLIFLILWRLNQSGGNPLLSRLLVSPFSGALYLKAGVLICWWVYLAGVFFRFLGTAYIGRQKIWSVKIRKENTQTTGPFRYLRHPVYAGSLLIIFSLAPLCSPQGALFLLSTAGLFTYYLARQEETILDDHQKGGKQGSSQGSSINRFWPKKGFFTFLRNEGMREIGKKKKEIFFSEFYNIAFGAGFFVFGISLSVRAFWYAFLGSLALMSTVLLYFRIYSPPIP